MQNSEVYELSEQRNINICLYCAIPEQDQFKAQRYSVRERWKCAVRHALDIALTKLSGQLHFDVHSYKVAKGLDDNSNRGDMAIRLALRSQLERAFAPSRINFMEVKWGHLAHAIASINREVQLFLVAGGGYISIDGDGSPWAMLVADDELLKKLACPIAAIGIGVNRLMNEPLSDISCLPEDTKSKISSLSALCRQISVRDRTSVELFAAHGEKAAALVGDPVLYFDAGTPVQRIRSSRPKIGINLAAHGRRTYSMLQPILLRVIDLLRRIQREQGAEFHYLMHHDFELPIAEFLKGKGVNLKIIKAQPLQLIEAYKGLDFVINQMLHSCIFAANAGVPFLNIAYDVKCSAFCDLLGVPECALSHDQVGRGLLEDRFRKLWGSADSISDIIIKHRDALRMEGEVSLRRLVASLE